MRLCLNLDTGLSGVAVLSVSAVVSNCGCTSALSDLSPTTPAQHTVTYLQHRQRGALHWRWLVTATHAVNAVVRMHVVQSIKFKATQTYAPVAAVLLTTHVSETTSYSDAFPNCAQYRYL